MVIDCSITMNWCFPDERTPATRKVFRSLESESALVPPHYFLEVANVLLTTEKQGRITRSQADQFVHLLGSLRILVDDKAGVFTDIVPLCRAHKLTSYDAA